MGGDPSIKNTNIQTKTSSRKIKSNKKRSIFSKIKKKIKSHKQRRKSLSTAVLAGAKKIIQDNNLMKYQELNKKFKLFNEKYKASMPTHAWNADKFIEKLGRALKKPKTARNRQLGKLCKHLIHEKLSTDNDSFQHLLNLLMDVISGYAEAEAPTKRSKRSLDVTAHKSKHKKTKIEENKGNGVATSTKKRIARRSPSSVRNLRDIYISALKSGKISKKRAKRSDH